MSQELGSDNIFADFGTPAADQHLIKAKLDPRAVPMHWKTHDKTERCLDEGDAAVIVEEVSQTEPDHAKFEQGNTLGQDQRGWRRAKFLGRFRLFFRFDNGPRSSFTLG